MIGLFCAMLFNAALPSDTALQPVKEQTSCVSVADFGAVPNDEEDDQPAIQKALDTALETDGTVTVKIPSGVYYIDKRLEIHSDTRLYLAKDAVLKSRNDSDYILTAAKNPDGNDLHYDRIKNVTISGGIFDSNPQDTKKSSGIMNFWNGRNITVKNTEFKNCCGTHFLIFNAIDGGKVLDTKFTNMVDYTGTAEEYYAQTKRLHLYYYSAEALHIDFMYKNELTGEKGTPCKNIVVKNCTFDNVASGIGTHHKPSGMTCDNIRIVGNYFKNCWFYCVNTGCFSGFDMRNNRASKCGGLLRAVNTSGTVKNNNIIARSRLSGREYRFDKFSGGKKRLDTVKMVGGDLKFSGNTLRSSSSSAFSLSHEASADISGCKISGANVFGVHIRKDTPNVRISADTRISGCARGALKLDSAVSAKSVADDITVKKRGKN